MHTLRRFALVSLMVLPPAQAAQTPVRVMSFNIRYGTANDGAHRWPNRAAHVITTIRDHAPHVLGIQEALRFQLDEIALALPRYREFGVGRDDGKTSGEYAAVLVDTARFAVASNGHFWYSDTPTVPSKHWGNNVIRICTWVRLVDRTTHDTIRVYNSHWDHESQPSRVKAAEALLARIAADSARNDAILVLGDFNTDESNPAFRALTGDARVMLRDTYRAVHPNASVVGTFNSFRGDSTQGKIDAILATSQWDVVEAAIDRRRFGELWASDHFAVTTTVRRAPRQARPVFEPAQPELFALGSSMLNAWADYDGDGDLDLYVGFNGTANRLYQNTDGAFTDVAATAGLNAARATRGAAWGDYDADGDADLLVGFAPGAAGPVLKLFRNDRGIFADATVASGITAATGAVRQLAWVDFDGDGDLDLFVAFRDRANALWLNTRGAFTEVAAERRIADSSRTVGAVWFDYDEDGDLDLVVGNMDGDQNAVYRNARGTFTREAGDIAWGGRATRDSTNGTVRTCAADANGDGKLDLFFANYGRNGLFLNRGAGKFEDVSAAWGITQEGKYDACAFDDFDNDGRLDLYVNGTVTGGISYPDILYRNTGARYDDVTPDNIRALQADHGVQWADFDRDGDADLALTGSRADGMHSLLRNMLAGADRTKSIALLVTDARGHLTRAGAEVRVYESGSRRLIGTQLVDGGSGYNTQNQMPVRFGLGNATTVDVEVTYPNGQTRQVVRVNRVDVTRHRGTHLAVRVP